MHVLLSPIMRMVHAICRLEGLLCIALSFASVRPLADAFLHAQIWSVTQAAAGMSLYLPSETGIQRQSEHRINADILLCLQVPLWGQSWIPWAPAVAYTSIAIALFSIYWAFFGRPEFGDLASRWEFLQYSITHDRAFDVSVSDTICYSFWQTILMDGAPAKYRYIPFIGPALWLIDIPAQKRVLEEAPQRHNQ